MRSQDFTGVVMSGHEGPKKDSFSTMTCSSFKGLKGQSCVNRVAFTVGFACFVSFRLFRQARRFWNRFHEHDTTSIAHGSMMKSKENLSVGPGNYKLTISYMNHEVLLCQMCVF